MRYRFLALIFLIIVTSCRDDFDEWGYVNFYIEPDSTEYYNLNVGTRQWEYFQGGNRGVIVFRLSYTDFKAYERSCTLKGCNGFLVADTNTNLLVECPKCGSKWLCVDGSPLEGSKAKRMLYEYCAYYDGWRLYVHNCNN